MEGVDYSFTRPDVWCLASSGLRFAGRYFGPGTADKRATRAECEALAAAGLDVVALAEGFEADALNGTAVGRRHAELAAADVQAAGGPDNAPIYFAVDFDVSRSGMDQVAYYFDGVQSVIGAARTGIYGGITAMEYAAQFGTALWYFQTYAWSGGRWFSGNHFEQYDNGISMCGGVVDRCRSRRKSFGQWRPGGGLGVGDDAPPPTQADDGSWDMAHHFHYVADVTGWLAQTNNDLGRAIESLG